MKNRLEKVYTDKKVCKTFLASVFAVGGVGILTCLGWFVSLCVKGIPVGWIIFDVAIIIFCLWALVMVVVPMTREIFESFDREERGE
jgi:cadmium resistance protein CadD (predicted permease)